ncbi:MAG: PVC-type heme-binding CxxCH protein, partial [Pirellulaceae bacterium]
QLRLADDRLQVELVAVEPQVIDPVAAQFDENGRLWVVEMRDYPHGPPAGKEPQSQIKILQDQDGDGRFESMQVFADHLLFVTELLPWKGGAIVTLAGEVVYMKDTDGDGRADQRETWYRGFAQENSQLRANHPRLGLDGWVYVSNGLRGGTVVDARRPDAPPVPLAGKDFRFHPRTFDYEAITGAGQFGLSFDDFGNRYICSNRNPLMHVVLEERYIQRNPLYAPPAARHDVGRAGEESRIYAISRGWTTSNLHAGQFTAACGVAIYRGEALPAEYAGNGFTCDPTGNLVHREIIVPAGATFTYQPTDSRVEFLASPDEWFRPVNVFLGPDGALYIVDMCRAVIEHPDFMPEELKRRPDLMLGTDRGRIYRVTKKGAPRPAMTQLSLASRDKLVELLGKSGWHADTALRLLYEQPESLPVEALRVAATTLPPVGAVRALWLLQEAGKLTDETLDAAMAHADPRVREHAIRIADTRASTRERSRPDVARLASDGDPKVRFWAALTLAPAANSEEIAAIQQVALRGADDVWTRRAVALAAGERAPELAQRLLEAPTWTERAPTPGELELLREMTALAGNRIRESDAVALLAAVLDLSHAQAGPQLQRVLLRALAEPLARQGKTLRSFAGRLPTAEEKQRLEHVFASADTTLVNASARLEDRLDALQLLAFDGEYADTLADIAQQQGPAAPYPQELRLRAVSALSRFADVNTWKKILSNWPSESAPFRRALLDALLARPERTEALLDEIAAGNVRPAELETTVVNRLLKQGRPELRSRTEKLLASAIPADRQLVLQSYQHVLELKSDARRGREIFSKNCATCHRIGELGVNVAPDISDSRVKKPEQLLTDILQPNRAIDNNYLSYTVVTTEGQSLTGIIASETGTSVTLRQQEGKDVILARSEIEELRSNGISLMPEGLEKTIPPQEMADLISFIKNWRYLDGLTPLGSD